MRWQGVRTAGVLALLALLSRQAGPPPDSLPYATLEPHSGFPSPLNSVPALAGPRDPASFGESGVSPTAGWTVAAGGTLAAGPRGMFRLDAGGLRMDVPGAWFEYAFESARLGFARLAAREGVAPSIDDAGAAVYRRGEVEEKYVGRGSTVEQLFVITSLPAPGDLVVRGRVASSAAFDPSRSDDQHLAYGAIHVEKAVAYDGAGRSTACRLAHADGGLEITVPGTWLARAALPVTIDPIIGTILQVDNPATSVVASHLRNADVAHNAVNNEYLVVFAGEPATANDSSVFGQRLNAATGARIGARISIEVDVVTPPVVRALRPAVSWNSVSNTYLVAWVETPTLAGTVLRVKGRILQGADPTMISAKMDISELGAPGQFESSVDVTHNPDDNEWFVVWARVEGTVTTQNGNIWSRRIPATGLSALPQYLSIVLDSAPAQNSLRPSVAYLPAPPPVPPPPGPPPPPLPFSGGYIVAFSDAPVGGVIGEIATRRVSASGSIGAINTVSNVGEFPASDHDWPKIASNSRVNECLVVWDSSSSRDPADPVRQTTSLAPPLTFGDGINARRVTGAGAGIGSGSFAIQPAGGVLEWSPDVSYLAVTNEYVVAWTVGSPNLTTPGAGISAAVVAGGTNSIVENDVVIVFDSPAGTALDHIMPAVATRAGTPEALVAFTRFPAAGLPSVSQWAQRYQTPTSPSGPPGGTLAAADEEDDKGICHAHASGTGAGWAWGALLLAIASLALRRQA